MSDAAGPNVALQNLKTALQQRGYSWQGLAETGPGPHHHRGYFYKEALGAVMHREGELIQIIIPVWENTGPLNDPRHQLSLSITLTGPAFPGEDGIWGDVKFFSLWEHELMPRLEKLEARLVRAWNALCAPDSTQAEKENDNGAE